MDVSGTRFMAVEALTGLAVVGVLRGVWYAMEPRGVVDHWEVTAAERWVPLASVLLVSPAVTWVVFRLLLLRDPARESGSARDV